MRKARYLRLIALTSVLMMLASCSKKPEAMGTSTVPGPSIEMEPGIATTLMPLSEVRAWCVSREKDNARGIHEVIIQSELDSNLIDAVITLDERSEEYKSLEVDSSSPTQRVYRIVNGELELRVDFDQSAGSYKYLGVLEGSDADSGSYFSLEMECRILD